MASNNRLTIAPSPGRLFRLTAGLITLAIVASASASAAAEVPGVRAAGPAAAATNSADAPAAPADAGKSAAPPPAAVPQSQSFACSGPVEFAHFNYPLRHVARRLVGGEPLTIVAIGSSSTAGAGASSAAASYPSRLAVQLKQLLPGRDITVLNRGVNGEETRDMLARFAGVIAAHPDLVLWQVGTNSVLRDHPLMPHSALLREGIDELKAAGADVVLIDMQFAPRVIAKSETQGMEDQIALAAKDESVDLFRRFELMRNWHDVQHIPFDVFVSADNLHMNDWGYACVAKLLAAGIVEAARRPVAAAAHSAR